ncbi:MAG: hypothetical protein ABIP95_10585 [Pelobium sp.]
MKISISFLLALFGLQGCKGQGNKASQGEENKALPAEFNEYSFLNTKFESDKFEVVLLSEVEYSMGPSPIRLFYSINDQVILEAEKTSENTDGGVSYFKLDKNANTIDSIYVPRGGGESTSFIREYMVHTRYKGDCDYNTWPLDGDKTPKKMTIVNEDLSWPDEKTAEEQEKLEQKADYYFYDVNHYTNTNDQQWSLQKLFYCIDGKWQILYRPFPKSISIDSQLKSSRYRDNFYYSSDDEQSDDAKQKFSLKYYDKQQKLKYGHSIGGGSSGFSVKGWVGTGYFDIPLLNDTLKVKQSNLIVEEATPAIPKTRYFLSNGNERSVSPFNINIFTDPVLNFALYSTSKYNVYAIRKKQK